MSQPAPVSCPVAAVNDHLWAKPVQRSTQPIQPTSSGFEYDKMVDVVVADRESDIDKAAYKGDPTTNFRLAARDCHLLMRKHYKEMMTNIGANIYPLMVLADADDGVPGGIGSMITIYKDDLSIQRIVPTPKDYELLKNLSHMSIAVFTIVSPWFRCPEGLQVNNLVGYLDQVKIAKAAAHVPGVNIEPKLLAKALDMFDMVENHLTKWIQKKRCTIAGFVEFAQEMNKYVPNNIIQAARIQAEAIFPELQKIKTEMKEEWEKLYVVIPTVWPVSGINPRAEILSRLMTPEQMNSRVFMMDNMSTMAEYKETLGRIVGDRASSNLILGDHDDIREEMLYALATRQDLMANACDDAMNNMTNALPRPRQPPRYFTHTTDKGATISRITE